MTGRLRKLGFLHIVPFRRDDPATGFEEALQLFSYGEGLGLDGGWIRTRHLQYGVPSSAVFLAAAAQRTTRIDLGVAVIPTIYESPLRLAEDLATADLLSGGRLQPGLSVGAPRLPDDVAERVLGERWRDDDVSYARIERILGFIRGDTVDREREIGLGGVTELSSDRVEPHSPGLAARLWYGGGSLRSAEWAGRAGLNLLVSNISTAEDSEVFSEVQRQQIDLFRSRHPLGDAATVGKGHVILPTDNATPEQRERFAAYVETRTPRTLAPQGPGRTLIARDVIGSTAEIVDTIAGDAAFTAVDELLLELPFSFSADDQRHIVRELATSIGPALGWTPKA